MAALSVNSDMSAAWSERDREKRILNQHYLATNKFTAVLDTVDNYVNFHKTVVF